MTDTDILAGLVKPLEWLAFSDGTYHDQHCQYELETDGGFWGVTRGVIGGSSYVADCDTLEAAQAAANADHAARILASIDTDKLRALVNLLTEARADLADYVGHEWPEETRAKYPDINRRYRRDMDLCWRIDAALAAIQEPGPTAPRQE